MLKKILLMFSFTYSTDNYVVINKESYFKSDPKEFISVEKLNKIKTFSPSGLNTGLLMGYMALNIGNLFINFILAEHVFFPLVYKKKFDNKFEGYLENLENLYRTGVYLPMVFSIISSYFNFNITNTTLGDFLLSQISSLITSFIITGLVQSIIYYQVKTKLLDKVANDIINKEIKEKYEEIRFIIICDNILQKFISLIIEYSYLQLTHHMFFGSLKTHLNLGGKFDTYKNKILFQKNNGDYEVFIENNFKSNFYNDCLC